MNFHSYQPSQTAPPPPGAGPTVPSQAPPPSAPQQPAAPSGSLILMLMAFLPIILFMFFSSRSQQKKQKDLESKLKKGDRVVTQSGLVGKLVEPSEGRYARLEIAPGVRVQILRSSISGLDAADTAPAKARDDSASAGEKR